MRPYISVRALPRPRPVERLTLRIANKISKRDWQMFGGFSNPRLARVTRGKAWAYYYLHR